MEPIQIGVAWYARWMENGNYVTQGPYFDYEQARSVA